VPVPDRLSLYIHIPFCIRKCRYCDFYSVPYDASLIDDFIIALGKEWDLVSHELPNKPDSISTIFFGGGTPSLLSEQHWTRINDVLMKRLPISPDCEWTIECNPDSFTISKARLWHSMGVTRLTFGIQSLDDTEVSILGRPHTVAQSLAVLDSPILGIFKSIGADIMYGLPGQTPKSFSKTVDEILARPVSKHLSAYELTIATDTPFGKRKGSLPLPSEEAVCEMTDILLSKSHDSGFAHYEISNFAKPGHVCRHNQAYWNHSPYIGLGPASHSYVHPIRWSNVKDVRRYISTLNSNARPLDLREKMTPDTLLSELIFLRFRTAEGLNEIDFLNKTGQEFNIGRRSDALAGLRKAHLLVYQKPFWQPTEAGLRMADAIARKLI
jgi:oxygen-independent coproporphyrinogen III oxidase